MVYVGLQMLHRRWVSLLWWSIGVACTTGLVVGAYPAIRNNAELDKTFAGLPTGVQAALGLHNGVLLTSPAGYLDSQFFSNTLPILFLIFVIGVASRSVAGDEEEGTLELLLANPISRWRVVLGRLGALVVMLTGLVIITALILVGIAPLVKLGGGISDIDLVAGVVACALAALTYGAITLAVGMVTGKRSLGLAVASVLAALGYIIEGIAQQISLLRPVRAVMPWHWLIGSDPVTNGLLWQAWVLPLGVSSVFVGAGIAMFMRRDLH